MADLTKVTFNWNGGGSHVLVCGSFNNWKAVPMRKESGSNWVIDLSLLANQKFLYKFIVDGLYFYDPDKPFGFDEQGNVNNIIETSAGSANVDVNSLPKSVSTLQKEIAETFVNILQQIGAASGSVSIEQILKLVQVSKADGYDFTLPCYQLGQALSKTAPEVANLIVTKAKEVRPIVFGKIDQGVGEREKPLVNFTLNNFLFAAASIGEFLLPQSNPNTGENVLVEFSSPNTNKPQHLGHVRNNCLGEAISRMLTYEGFNVHKINLVNDRGIHICKSMLAYKKFGQNETPQSANKKGDHLVGDYYVRFEVELGKEFSKWLETPQAQAEFDKWKNSDSGKRIVEKNKNERKNTKSDTPDDFASFKSEYKDYYTNHFSELGRECNQMLVDWENGNEDVRKLWSIMNTWVFDGFRETYKDYGIQHDVWEKESEIYEYGKSIVIESYNNGILEKLDNGCIACDLINIGVLKKGSGEERKKVLLRANGTSVYMTQDVGTAARRLELYKMPSRIIYVVASEQDRHFQTLFKLLESLYPDSKGRWYHLSYGMVLLPTGRMKSREGTVVDADDLVSGLSSMAAKITKEKSPELSDTEIEHRAKKIALAAIKFYILAFNPPTTVTFSPENSLQFTGKSGPYLLYQYARTRSIFRKAGEDISSFKFDGECLSTLGTTEERELLRALYLFPRDVHYAVESRDPSKVCDCIYNISQYFNAWYRLKEKHHVVGCKDPVLKQARLQLVMASGNAIQRGLQLLGIETLEQM